MIDTDFSYVDLFRYVVLNSIPVLFSHLEDRVAAKPLAVIISVWFVASLAMVGVAIFAFPATASVAFGVLPAGTQYDVQMQLLNEDTGNAFEIEIAPDSLNQEDLIEMVANGKIDYTVAEVKVARLYKSYYKKLDVRLPLGFAQRNGWLLRKDNECLRRYIEKWSVTNEMELLKTNLAYKYLRNSYYFNQKKVRIPKGAISPYDHLFKKFAPEIKWEWQMLAALVFHESRFDSAQVSWAGASGLMQLMPRTAANFGLSRRNIFNPESNIEAGVQYIKSLNLTFSKIEDKHERIKFILASDNSGPPLS